MNHLKSFALALSLTLLAKPLLADSEYSNSEMIVDVVKTELLGTSIGLLTGFAMGLLDKAPSDSGVLAYAMLGGVGGAIITLPTVGAVKAMEWIKDSDSSSAKCLRYTGYGLAVVFIPCAALLLGA